MRPLLSVLYGGWQPVSSKEATKALTAYLPRLQAVSAV